MTERHALKRHPSAGRPQPSLVEQVAPAVQTARSARAEESVAPTAPVGAGLSTADRALDRPNQAAVGQTAGGPDRSARHPARTASTGSRSPVALADDDQTGVGHPRLAARTGQPTARLFSAPSDDAQRAAARDGLDLSLSGRRPPGLRLSHAQPAHPSLCPNDRDQ